MRDNIWKNGIMGLVIGDALGSPVQFLPREKLRKQGLVTGMEAGGAYQTPAGTWTDDSSMALATMDSIICNNGINRIDIMSRFESWLYHGMYTPFGKAFDNGATCTRAIETYTKTHNHLTCGRTDEWANGNGGLMRILPACLYSIDEVLNVDSAITTVHAVTALTHNHPRALIGSGIYYFLANAIVISNGDPGRDLNSILQAGMDDARAFYTGMGMEKYKKDLAKYDRLFRIDDLKQINENGIRSSGYVVDTLEAAVWSLANTSSFCDALLLAVNLGHDADSVGAVTGGLAGLYYGYDDIPEDWLGVIQRREWIEDLCTRIAVLI